MHALTHGTNGLLLGYLAGLEHLRQGGCGYHPTDGAAPMAAAEPAPRPANPSRGVKSRTAAVRKRTRRPSTAGDAPSGGAMGETTGVRGTGPSPDDEHAKRVET
jgi:hypothetical protein